MAKYKMEVEFECSIDDKNIVEEILDDYLYRAMDSYCGIDDCIVNRLLLDKNEE